VREPEDQRVRGQHLEARLLGWREHLRASELRAVSLQRLDVVVGRVEPVVQQPEQRGDQLVEARRVAPLRAELLRLVIARHRIAEHDALAVHVVVGAIVLDRVPQVVDLFADRLAGRGIRGSGRSGGGCRRRHRRLACGERRQQQDEGGKGHAAHGHRRSLL
jgi:hypothetical protein